MSKSYLILDIETILDPELANSSSGDAERLPAPPHHKVVAIGVLWLDRGYTPRRLGVFGENKDEHGIVEDFAKFLEQRQPWLITFNGRGFDLPVIAMRCLRYGIPLRHYYRKREIRQRYTPEGHMDLMDFVADFGAAKPSRLDVVAKLCGMPGKVGIDGKDVAPLVHAGRLDEVRNYCLCDVVQTAGVFLRVQLLRGELSREAYLAAMKKLIAAIRADRRVAPVAAAINEQRLLLGVESSPIAEAASNTPPPSARPISEGAGE